jgi:hypothetical protein
MKKAYLQFWEESERGWGVRPDGCSLHLNSELHKSFVDGVYKSRDYGNIPHEYDRVNGNVLEVLVSETIYREILNGNGNLRLMQHSLSNLIKLEEINTMIGNEFNN